MANFCHDQYEHPLLWCDEKRRLVERKAVEEGLREVKKRKEAERTKIIRDRNEYREMIHKHCPWGKPGGGAPNEHIRRSNILLEGLFPESYSDCRKYKFQGHRGKLRGGGGAPLRSASGRILTSIRDDPIISFNDPNRYHVDFDLRYRRSPKSKMEYKMQLDKIVAEKEKLKRKVSMDVKHDPWGKAGPGGLPWRNPRNIGQSFMKSMGWTDKALLKTLDLEHTGKAKDELTKPSKIITEPMKSSSAFPVSCCINCCCQCGTSFKRSNDQYDRNLSKHHLRPIGQPTKADVIHNHHQPDVKPPVEIKVEGPPKQTKSTNPGKLKYGKHYPKTRNCMISGGVELVPLLAKRRAMYRPISLATTDVTKYPTINQHQESGHLSELCRQMDQKEHKKQIIKQVEMESTRKHFETLDSLWGRPGHGAPRDIKNKQNLNDLLYRVPFKAEYVL